MTMKLTQHDITNRQSERYGGCAGGEYRCSEMAMTECVDDISGYVRKVRVAVQEAERRYASGLTPT